MGETSNNMATLVSIRNIRGTHRQHQFLYKNSAIVETGVTVTERTLIQSDVHHQ
jgi:hypothetical protein